MEQTKKQIKWINIAKAIGIFLIVYGHIINNQVVRKYIYCFHVPLFFFISGLTFSKKYNQKEFIKKKIKTLYIPYIIVSIISIFIYLIMGKFIGENVSFNIKDLSNNIFGMIYANSSLNNMMWNRPLWFIPTLLITLIITNFTEQIKNIKTKNIVILLIVLLGMILSHYKIYLPFQMETAFSMLIWVYLGINLKGSLLTIEKKYNKKKLIIFIVICIIIGIVAGSFNKTVEVRIDYYGNNIPLYYISAFSLIIALIFISILIKNNRYIELIGTQTLYILLWHKFPILFFDKICPIIKDCLNSEFAIVQIITSVIISIFVIIMCLLFQKIINITLDKTRILKKSNFKK